MGPIYTRGGDPHRLLRECYRACLALATEAAWTSVAFPAISTGVYGYPKDEAAVEASTAIGHHLDRPTSVERVLLVFFAQAHADAFERATPWTADP